MAYPMDVAAQQQSTLSLIEKREHTLRELVEELTRRVRCIADRIYGQEPQAAPMLGGDLRVGMTVVSPAAVMIEHAQERAMKEVSELGQQIGRLENL